MAKKTRIDVEESSGNVFADLGLPNSEQEALKAGLTLQIFRVLKARRLPRRKPARSWGSRSHTCRIS